MDQLEQATLQGGTVKAEKKFGDMIEVLASIFTAPQRTALVGGTDDVNANLHFQTTTERMIRLMKASKSDLTKKQTEEYVMKLSDAEKLTILSNASLKAPLDQYALGEMQRLFLKVKGETAYRAIFGDEEPPEPRIYADIWKGK